MSPESRYIQSLKESLGKSKALTWVRPLTNHQLQRSFKSPTIALTYLEVKTLLKHESVVTHNCLVRKDVIHDVSKQLVSFIVRGLGLFVYSFANGMTNQLWFIPQRYLNYPQMIQAIDKLNMSIKTFAKDSVINVYISRLQWVVDLIDVFNTAQPRVANSVGVR